MARYVVKRPVRNIGRDHVCGYRVLSSKEMPPYGGFYVNGLWKPEGKRLEPLDEATALCEHMASIGIPGWTYEEVEGEAPEPVEVAREIEDREEEGGSSRQAAYRALQVVARRLMRLDAPEIALNSSAKMLKAYVVEHEHLLGQESA